MDDVVRRLERATRAAPMDEEAARRYERALLQAGREDLVRARYEAKFVCRLRFEDLAPTADPLVRSCGQCRRDVRFVTTEAELAERVVAGGCVAFARAALGASVKVIAGDRRLHTARESRRPCLVPTDLPFVDLDLVEVDAQVLQVVTQEVATIYSVFPTAATRDLIHLAMANPAAEGLIADLERELDLEVRPVLAHASAIERAIERHQAAFAGLGLMGWFESVREPRRCFTRERNAARHDDRRADLT